MCAPPARVFKPPAKGVVKVALRCGLNVLKKTFSLVKACLILSLQYTPQWPYYHPSSSLASLSSVDVVLLVL